MCVANIKSIIAVALMIAQRSSCNQSPLNHYNDPLALLLLVPRRTTLQLHITPAPWQLCTQLRTKWALPRWTPKNGILHKYYISPNQRQDRGYKADFDYVRIDRSKTAGRRVHCTMVNMRCLTNLRHKSWRWSRRTIAGLDKAAYYMAKKTIIR